MRFLILATAAILSAAPALAAPDAATLIDGYDRFYELGEYMLDKYNRINTMNAVIILPQMMTGMNGLNNELIKQSALVRDGVEPLPDADQQPVCDAFGKMNEIAGECLDEAMALPKKMTSLQAADLLGPFVVLLGGFAEPWDEIVDGFRQAAPSCAQATLDSGPDVSGKLRQAYSLLMGGR